MSIQLVRVNEGLGKPRRTPWPETFTPRVIARLLTWTGDIETGKEWECEDSIFSRWIEDACHSGELVPVTTTEEIRMDYGQGNSFWDLAESPRETKVALHHIAAAPLAHWLESQDHPPGELLKAWFKAQGVGVAPPAPSAPPEAVLMISPAPHKRQRSDLLTPLIGKAVKACNGSTDKHEVFNVLRQWATEKPPHPPLIGVTEKGIQWVSANDKATELSLDALAGRLKPPAKRG